MLFILSEPQVCAVLSVMGRVSEARGVQEAGAVIPRLHGEGGAGAAEVAQGEAGQPAARRHSEDTGHWAPVLASAGQATPHQPPHQPPPTLTSPLLSSALRVLSCHNLTLELYPQFYISSCQ